MGSRSAQCLRRLGAPIVVGLTLFGPVAPVSADEAGPFGSVNASAVADGVRMTLTVPGAPVSSKVIDGGGPSSEARMGTFTGSHATAALPHPGESGKAGPGTAAGFLASNGLEFPVEFPPYPFSAAAEYPARPEQKVGEGPYVVEAKTGAGSALGLARSGFQQEDGSAAGGFAVSTSSVGQTADGVVAEGVSNFEGLTVGPLTIGQVTSVAKTEVGPDGELTRTSSMSLSGVRVDDNAIEFTPAGIVVGSDPLPVPAADFVATLNELLAPSKMQVSLMPAEETPNGVVSPTFEIRTPTPNPRGSGEGTWQIIVGATASSVDVELASAGDESSSAADEEAEAPSAGGTAQTLRSTPAPSPHQDRSLGTAGGSVGNSFGSTSTEHPRGGVDEFGFAAPEAPAAEESAAPLATEASGGDVAMGAADPQVVLPAARSAALLGDGFDIRPVYLLFGGLVLAGFFANVLVGGVKRA